jgi:hypothetical protein
VTSWLSVEPEATDAEFAYALGMPASFGVEIENGRPSLPRAGRWVACVRAFLLSSVLPSFDVAGH